MATAALEVDELVKHIARRPPRERVLTRTKAWLPDPSIVRAVRKLVKTTSLASACRVLGLPPDTVKKFASGKRQLHLGTISQVHVILLLHFGPNYGVK